MERPAARLGAGAATRPAVPRPANMGDVARLAGVSHQTVSRVINQSSSVSPATRDRVLDAMRQLDYRPNSAAKSLVTGRSSTLGVVSFDPTLFGPASTLAAIERAARSVRYAVSVASLKSIDRESVVDAIERLRDQSVAGIVVIAPTEVTFDALAAVPPHTPLVAVEGDPHRDFRVVAVDQAHGARMATEHLLELGHRTVWHVRGPETWLEAEGRVQGWREALRAAGVAPPEPPLAGDWSPASGYEAGLALAERPEVSAVFVANDQMAVGLLRAMHERGRKVPEDVSVVGFDDIPEAAYLTPPLTTVRQPFDEVGRRSLRLLLEQVDAGERIQRREIVGPLLVRRRSAAPAAGPER
jgi:DNA-binding LacI/PurR family transcriptional regulator